MIKPTSPPAEQPQTIPAANPAPAQPQPQQSRDELEDAITQAVGFILLISEWTNLKLVESDDNRLLFGIHAMSESIAERLENAFYKKG